MNENKHVLSKWIGTASGWTCRYSSTVITAQEAPRFDKVIVYQVGNKDTFEGNLDELRQYLEDNREKYHGDT